MRKTSKRLAVLCYFKSMTRDERQELLAEYRAAADGCATAAAAEEVYETYRARVSATYKNDGFKIYMLALNAVILLASLVLPLAFFHAPVLWGVAISSLYVLYPTLVISVLVGAFLRKIRIKEYAYHGLLAAAHVMTTCLGVTFILYRIAEALGNF